MKKYRSVITYKNYFEDFLNLQRPKVVSKILQILRIVEQVEQIPVNHLKHVEGTNGLFEIRVKFGSDIFRIFCFFDAGRLVVLLSGFQKKTQKTPPEEIKRAVKLMEEYYKEKEEQK
ncbi:type II toxin-antitoxin system RelE/ParE family toxin [uncultured Bacteroides sp.]|jgi:phage-related protein|uniref:type II toxin-antitoxin system RelE/ParE family toxin n=1 Tax=uncultured Bacteroides sp. TaxID=162156 RepID=UPI0025F989F8|nr:type II toxin-antitoxin system RelE/ParE family toxin [uncultured Bacteroides sp.]